ncbi:hypothetical protein LIS82_26845 (plasmid) [Cytobacillus solani]|uniref:hypothetical protein n=1 Tax=Cytobacillus solani TaxID=1637975 RepID=UPI00207AB2DF|nr:hypothetical protein [Cytobacillus solani]USK57839.1 hypothetical protein LIS82_26845 [Cytobacillus solani]
MADISSIGKMIRQLETNLNSQVFDYYKGMQPVYQSIIDSFQSIYPVYSTISTYLNNNKIIESITNISRGFFETEEDIKVFKALMVENGYPPYQGITISIMRKIAQTYEKNKDGITSEVIDNFMRTYFSPNKIEEISLEWEDNVLLFDRLPILRNVIMAHNLGMFNLSIPSILAQLEGVLVDMFNIKGRVDGNIVKILLRTLLNDKEKYSTFNFDNDIYNFYNKNVIKGFEHGNVVESSIGRNAILHGGSTKYGTFHNSLKLILLFDHISTAGMMINEEKLMEARREVKRYRTYRNSSKKK